MKRYTSRLAYEMNKMRSSMLEDERHFPSCSFNMRTTSLCRRRVIIYFHCFRPIANKLFDERTYITPSDRAGVAISISPIEFVAM